MSVKERVERIGRWVKYYWMWIACGIIAFGVGGVTYYCLPLAEGDAPLYLLSALSQGLAAIFTLIFAITVFAAQMMRKFTAMDKLIDKWTIILMLVFTIGIILPLIQLKTDKNLLGLSFVGTVDLSLSIDLAIATFCVLSIIPYLKKVNRTMKYEGGIPKLKEEASEAIDSGHKVTTSHKINELAELGESAANDIHKSHELQTTIKVIRELRNIGIGVAEKEWEHQTKEVLVGLREIGSKAVKKRLDDATEEVLEALTEVGIKAADKKLLVKRGEGEDSVASFAIDGLIKICVKAINKELSDSIINQFPYSLLRIGVKAAERNLGWLGNPIGLIEEVKTGLIEIGDNAYKKDETKKVSRDSMVCLWILGASVQKYLPDHDENMAMDLKGRDIKVIRNLFEKEYNNAKDYANKYANKILPPLTSDLETFLETYKSCSSIRG